MPWLVTYILGAAFGGAIGTALLLFVPATSLTEAGKYAGTILGIVTFFAGNTVKLIDDLNKIQGLPSVSAAKLAIRLRARRRRLFIQMGLAIFAAFLAAFVFAIGSNKSFCFQIVGFALLGWCIAGQILLGIQYYALSQSLADLRDGVESSNRRSEAIRRLLQDTDAIVANSTDDDIQEL